MLRKRGFTLVEVLVVIAISAIVMTTVGTTFVFIATSSGDLIHRSEELMEAQTIETYLRGLVEKEGFIEELKKVDHDENNGDITYDGNIRIAGTTLVDFTIYTEPAKGKEGLYFVKCRLEYESSEYVFTLGISNESIPEEANEGIAEETGSEDE